MSRDAILDVTKALRERLEQAVTAAVGGSDNIHVGPPVSSEMSGQRASLFLFNVTPNREMRNTERTVPPPAGSSPQAAVLKVDALPVDLHYLVTVFRKEVAEPNELQVLGAIMQALHGEPTLSGGILTGQTVRVTLEPYALDDLNRIWGLFPEDAYRTSVVYLVSPVFIEAALEAGPPVQARTLKHGVLDASNSEETGLAA